MRWILAVCGTFLLIDGVAVSFIESFNWGVALTIVLGFFLVVWSLNYHKINLFMQRKKWVKNLKNFVLSVLCAELIFVSFVQIYGMHDTVTYEEDAIIVLGAAVKGEEVTSALKLRLDKTLEYIEKNPDVIIVVSGGKGLQESAAEAETMRKYLVKHGVPEKQIICEYKATSTAENMTFSKELLDEKFYNPYEELTDKAFPEQNYLVGFITNDFHVCRSVMLAKKRGFYGMTHLHTESQWYNYVPYYIRETMAMVKSIVFD